MQPGYSASVLVASWPRGESLTSVAEYNGHVGRSAAVSLLAMIACRSDSESDLESRSGAAPHAMTLPSPP